MCDFGRCKICDEESSGNKFAMGQIDLHEMQFVCILWGDIDLCAGIGICRLHLSLQG